MDESEPYKKLINEGLENFNMFHIGAELLHNQSLLNLNSEMKDGLLVGGTLGTLDLGKMFSLQHNIHLSIILAKTKMPEASHWQGFLIVALDPLKKINDVDRSDNVFVQYIKLDEVSITTEGGGSYGKCSVNPHLNKWTEGMYFALHVYSPTNLINMLRWTCLCCIQ